MRITVSCFIVGLLLLFPVNGAYNIDTSPVDKALDAEYSEYIGMQTVDSADLESGLGSLLKSGMLLAKKKLKNACGASFAIIMCCALISLVKNLSSVSQSSLAVKVTDYTGSFAIVYIALSSGGGLLTKCAESINDISIFSRIVTPVFAVAAAVSQHPSTAISTAGVTMLFTNLFTSLTLSLFIPLIVAYIVAYAAGAVSEIGMLSKLCNLIKWLLSFCCKTLLIAFIGYISVSGIISSNADAVTLKTAKMVISSAVPVVGGIIADASDTILSGAVIVKNSVGIIGFLGVAAISLVPFVSCFIYHLVYKVTSAISSTLCGGAVAKVVEGVATAYGLALGCLGACSAVQFVAIVIMSAVTMV